MKNVLGNYLIKKTKFCHSTIFLQRTRARWKNFSGPDNGKEV